METSLQLTVFILVTQGVSTYISINEVDSFNPKTYINTVVDINEFVELYNNESETVMLDNYVLVFYSGYYNPPKAYKVIDLTGYNITGNGYFLIASRNVSFPVDYFFANTFNNIWNGNIAGAAVGLHYRKSIGELHHYVISQKLQKI